MILGIDLGTNSVGWALRDKRKKRNKILEKGVLLFDKSVATEKGNEFPKVQKRTESRGKRRNYQAEKYRKFELLEFLINNNMCPLSIEELDTWRKYRKGEKRKYPQSQAFINWIRFDFDGNGKPDFHLLNKTKHESYYIFRTLAIDEEYKEVYQQNPHLLGRVFYQLVQRRGFKGRDEEEAKTMLEGSSKTNTAGRNAISDYIDRHKTLGAALYYYQKENGGRIRQRYNLRKDYEAELKEICKIQGLDDAHFAKLRKAIIWQRPLRTQKGTVGLCTFEKNKRRAAVSHPLYQEYKTWVFINNLKIVAPDGVNKAEYLRDKIYPLFIRKSDFEVKDIIHQLNKDGASLLSNYMKPKMKNTKVVSLSNFYDLEQIFGNNWKEDLRFNEIFDRSTQPEKKQKSGYSIEDLWHVLVTFDSKEKLFEFALDKLILDEDKAKRFSEIRLPNGYATLSLSAIKRILPYLQQGIIYSTAVYLANLPKVLGRFELSEKDISYFIEEMNEVNAKTEKEKNLNTIINKLIRSHLEEGYRYFIEDDRDLDEDENNTINEALKSQFGERGWSELSDIDKEFYSNRVAQSFKEFLRRPINSKQPLFMRPVRFHEELFSSLQEKYDLPDENIKYLWHPSEQEKYSNAEMYQKYLLHGKEVFINERNTDSFEKINPEAQYQGFGLKLLGSPEPISKGFKNPMALKTLHKLKQLLNYMCQTGKIDEDTKVVVEIARELNDNNMRAAIRSYQNQREKENAKYSKQIEEINKECRTEFDPSDQVLLKKIRLWEEQNKKCLYTGKSINLCDVLDGNKFDLEHTIPVSLSFDSELKNLTLANTEFNRLVKKKQLPSQLENYSDIKRNVQFIQDKVDKLEADLRSNLRYTKTISDKNQKDTLVQKRHLIKFDLNYWKAKLDSFCIQEFKPQWRNSQLRDTQIVTKYALPYLKTVFKNVSVEKGSVVSDFKNIFQVQIDEKKDRNKHSHHAVDAAILTLIPNSYNREKILEEYYEAKERKIKYHNRPKDWEDFKASYIINIENEILANNLVDDRTLTPTYKKARKRGRIIKSPQGKTVWNKGDTIRGQLHSESFYGAIKQPLRNDNGKIMFDENQKMVLDDEVKIVKRKDLKYRGANDQDGFRSLDEIEKAIVDKALFEQIKNQVIEKPFKEVLEEGIYMLDKNGRRVNRIRRIRCYENLVKFNTAIQVHKHSFKSRFDYKTYTHSKNEQNAYCLYYEGSVDNKVEKAIKIISLFELSKLGLSNPKEFLDIPFYSQTTVKKKEIPIKAVLKTGDRFLFYKNYREELLDLDNETLLKRLYKAYQFESDGRIKFRHHLLAGDLTQAKKIYSEASKLAFDEYQPLLRIRQGQWNFAIEGIDFNIELDGQIVWLTV